MSAVEQSPRLPYDIGQRRKQCHLCPNVVMATAEDRDRPGLCPGCWSRWMSAGSPPLLKAGTVILTALLALLLAVPALAAPARRLKPLESVTVKTMPSGTLKAGEHIRVTALDADSCTAWIEEPRRAEVAFLGCHLAISRCKAGDCRKGARK